MLVELTMLTLVATSTGPGAGLALSPPYPLGAVERPSVAQPFTLAEDAASPASLWLAKSSGSSNSGSRGTRSSKGSSSSSNHGAGGYQSSGEGGYRQTGQGGYQGSGGSKPMDITPPNSPPGIRTSPPMTPPWSPQWSPPGN
jgi:hypothetical protein